MDTYDWPLSYRVNDFIKLTGISRTSTYALIKKGELRAVSVAGRTLIPADEAKRLVAEAPPISTKNLSPKAGG